MLTEDGYRRLERRKAHCSRTESTLYMAGEVWRRSVRFQQELRSRLETCRTELLIRRKLAQGRLPSDRQATMVGQPGRGGRCDGPPLRLHADCFLLWDRIRLN